MRLNIIDTKVSYLLRLNAIESLAVSLIIAVTITDSGFTLTLPWHWGISLIIVIGGVGVSFFFCYAMGELQFDNVTTPPSYITGVPRATLMHGTNSDLEAAIIDQNVLKSKFTYDYRHYLYVWDALITAEKCLAIRRGAGDYEDMFFKITIARQKMLGIARAFTFASWLGYFFLMVFLVDCAVDFMKIIGECPGCS